MKRKAIEKLTLKKQIVEPKEEKGEHQKLRR
jgi:hypothetical protein